MVVLFPNDSIDFSNKQMFGNTMYFFSILQINKTNAFAIEPSVVLDTSCFAEYLINRILPNHIVDDCIEALHKLQIEKVDIYTSYYSECFLDTTPLTVSVSSVSIHNAIKQIFERWFDYKPYSERLIHHLNPSDTYPALIIQEHREEEFSLITRDSKAGTVLRIGDGDGNVNCSHAITNKQEEQMIQTIDHIFDLPVKVYYTSCPKKERIIVRRIDHYHLTENAEATVIVSKYKQGFFTLEKAISLIQVKHIIKLLGHQYKLEAKFIHKGLTRNELQCMKGYAVFPWTDKSKMNESSIFLSLELSMEEIETIAKCQGCIFARGGYTSHGAVASHGMGKIYITGCGDLRFDPDNQIAETSDGEIIHENDVICIVGGQWALNGELYPNDNFTKSCSSDIFNDIVNMLNPIKDTKKLAQYPLEFQSHVAELVNAIKKRGKIA